MIIESIDLPEYQKILDDPEAELKALAKRIIPWLEDSQYITNHAMYCFVMMAWSQVGRLAEELSISKAMTESSDGSSEHMDNYYKWTYQGKKSAAMICIRAIRESMDALDAVKPKLMSAERELRQCIAEDIRSELVCCDIYQRMEGAYRDATGVTGGHEEGMAAMSRIMRSSDYHDICHYGEWSARIAQSNE